MTENMLEAQRAVSRTIKEKNAEIRRLEIANAELVRRCAEYERKYVIVSTLMRRFARMRSLDRWAARVAGAVALPARERTIEEHDRMTKALVDKPWEVVTDL